MDAAAPGDGYFPGGASLAGEDGEITKPNSIFIRMVMYQHTGD